MGREEMEGGKEGHGHGHADRHAQPAQRQNGIHSRLELVESHDLAALLDLRICETLSDISVEPIFGNSQSRRMSMTAVIED